MRGCELLYCVEHSAAALGVALASIDLYDEAGEGCDAVQLAPFLLSVAVLGELDVLFDACGHLDVS